MRKAHLALWARGAQKDKDIFIDVYQYFFNINLIILTLSNIDPNTPGVFQKKTSG